MQLQNVTEGQKNTLSTEKTKWIKISLIGKFSLYLIKHQEVWWYGSTLSSPRHYAQVSGYIHILACLTAEDKATGIH